MSVYHRSIYTHKTKCVCFWKNDRENVPSTFGWNLDPVEPLRFICKRHHCCTHLKAIHSMKLQIRCANISLRTSNHAFMISCKNSDNYAPSFICFKESAIVYEVSCRFASVTKTHWTLICHKLNVKQKWKFYFKTLMQNYRNKVWKNIKLSVNYFFKFHNLEGFKNGGGWNLTDTTCVN